MRYEIRWNNGAWKTFDTERYTDVAAHGLRKEAELSAAKMNARPTRR